MKDMMLRLTSQGTLAALAIAAQAGGLRAQATAGAQAARVMVSTRQDSAQKTEYVLVRRPLPPRIDSLMRKLEGLPIGSAEFIATNDSLRAEISALPRPVSLGAGGTVEVSVSARPGLRFSPIDVVPVGWFGFVADGVSRVWDLPTGSYIEYLGYPEVVAIEPNSPASRAGVRSGDSVLAYNGRDLLKNVVNLTQLLTPGNEVAVRVRRNGEFKDITIAVEKAPASVIADRRAEAARMMASQPVPAMADEQRRIVEGRRTVELRAATVAAAGAGARGAAGDRPMQPTTVAGQVAFSRGLLGAAMTDVDADLAESLRGMDGKRGVLVTLVPTGSPADRMGLRKGDVILRVGANDVPNVTLLALRLMEAEQNRPEKVKLRILRAGKTQELAFEPR